MSHTNFDNLQPAYREALRRYGGRSNVTGVDIGRKYRGPSGILTNQIAVRLHVLEKVQPVNLAPGEMFSEVLTGVPTDVIKATYRPQTASAVVRTRTAAVIQPGISVGHYQITGGTLGLIVYDRDGVPHMLSNWHVLAGERGVAGDRVLQPCKRFGGDVFRHGVAHLVRSLHTSDGDAAIARLDTTKPLSRAQLESGVVLKGVRDPRLGEVLEKSGAVSGVTRAVVDGVGHYFIDYNGTQPVGVNSFKLVPKLRAKGRISQPGDSGCVWYARGERQGIGLHFAGDVGDDPQNEHALACHLGQVLGRLEVSLVDPAPP